MADKILAEPILAVEGISKRFGGLLALREASLTVESGSITAVIGPNGAGKTTLFALITGFLTPSVGRIVYLGANITGMPAHRLARQGIARTFQIVQPFAGLSVLENIAVGAHLHIAGRAAALAAAADVAKLVGLDTMLEQPAATLTVAARKRLELARALATSPKLLLLDEVLAGLNPSEIRDMVPIIRAIRERGVTILMIEHVMQAVMSLAEQIYVLVEGHTISQGPPATVAADPKVIEAYLGAGAAAKLAGGAHGR
jgi:branched-chain amino acid transport system ATP-binding protein